VTGIPPYRRPLASGFSHYLFDPHTLLLHVPGDKQRFADGPHFASEFHDHYLSLVHECVHWLQLQGTTFGAFVQLISHSQGRNSLGRLEAMPARKRARLIERRILKNEPVVLGGYSVKTGDAEIDELRENWLDHEYTFRLMMDGLDPGVRIDRGALVSFVCGVCCLAVTSLAGFQQYIDDDWASGVFRAGDDGVFELATNDGRITVRSLFEGAATAQEFLALKDLERLSVFDRKQQVSARRRLREALTVRGFYGRAFRLFARTLRFDAVASQREDVLHLFAFLCDLALNPTVPPAVVPRDLRLQWSDMYPPARFVRILQKIKPSERVHRKLAPDTVVELRRRLLENAELPEFPEQLGPAFWARMKYTTFLANQPSEAARTVMEHQRYRFWAEARCWDLRSKYPWAFVSLHDVLLGGRQDQPWRYSRSEDCRAWVQPPFRWVYKGTRASRLGLIDVERAHGTDILLAAAVDYSQFELMRKRGPLVLRQFPSVDRVFFRQSIRGSYEQRFQVAAFQKW
jgi:hypothetical protein